MSQKETTEILGHHEVGDSSIENLSKLATQARQAYEQNRRKECLDLTRAILLIDPGNADAQWMRSAIQSQLHQDLENSRAFLKQAESRTNAETRPEPPRTPADETESLLQETRRLAALSEEGSRNTGRRWIWITAAAIVLAFTLGGFLRVLTRPTQAKSASPAAVAASSADAPKTIGNTNPPTPSDAAAPAPVEAPIPPPPVRPAIPPPSAVATPVSRPVQQEEAPAGPAGTGTLAVSSPTTVDIYKDDAFLGSAPVSLSMTAGTHTLEYRHGNMRRTLTHVINNNETTKAMVTFDATVQINSRPWAEVYLDGAERKDLGQTPLSGVRVPIGSVLIFQNPQFQPKRYRVTGNETGIQINFP